MTDIPDWLQPAPDPVAVIMAELEMRERSRDNLTEFARNVMGIRPALHHEVMCEALMALVNDEYDDLIINMPPGAAKTTYAAKAFIAWLLCRPQTANWQVIFATHSAKLAEQVGKATRDIVASPTYQTLTDTTLSTASTAALRWHTDKGGEFYGVGAGASILGFRANIVIQDDVVGGAEVAESLEQLQKLHEWYETDLITRLKPQGKVICICQRLARNDMAGYLMDRNAANPTRRLKVLKFTMECDDEDNDPLHRAVGERLWPEWFTPEWVADCKRDEYKWKTLYMQSPPSDSGDWVSEENIKVVDIIPHQNQLRRYTCSDLALSVGGGDYSVHFVCGVDENHDLYIEDAWRGRVSPEVTADKHLDMVETYGPIMESLIDDDNASRVYVQLLAARSRERRVPVPWKTLPLQGKDKETRAAALRGWFRRGKVFMKRAPWNTWLKRELLGFPNLIGSGVDDGVDALSLMGRRLASLARPATMPVVVPKPTLQNMTLDGLWDTAPKNTAKRY